MEKSCTLNKIPEAQKSKSAKTARKKQAPKKQLKKTHSNNISNKFCEETEPDDLGLELSDLNLNKKIEDDFKKKRLEETDATSEKRTEIKYLVEPEQYEPKKSISYEFIGYEYKEKLLPTMYWRDDALLNSVNRKLELEDSIDPLIEPEYYYYLSTLE